jgi:small ligand-binding sensory domain FIST
VRWASAVSRESRAAEAFGEAAKTLEHQLEGSEPDLLLAFASPDHARECEVFVDLAARRFPRALLVGCTAGGVIGDAHEVEDGPALSLTAAALPDVALSALRIEPDWELADPSTWRARVGLRRESRPKFLLLADPFTTDVGALVDGLDRAYPGAPKFGGLASGGRAPSQNRLFIGDDVYRNGGVGVVLSGNVAVDTIIAQGCRPIGTPMIVTRCEHNVLQELDGRPPLQVLSELYLSLNVRDRELMQSSLFLGLEMRSDEVEYKPGELLVRNLVGADESTGALAIGAELRPMTVAQFVLRDAHSAEQELRQMLERHRRATSGRPAGALLFSCVGRGAGLFGHADHDTSLFEEQLGPAPLGGFFCNGEIGPVGGTTFLHGYTSAFAMFRAAPPEHLRGAQGGEAR